MGKFGLILLGLLVSCSFYWVVQVSKDNSSVEQIPVENIAEPIKQDNIFEYYQFKFLKPDDLRDLGKVFESVQISVLDMGAFISGSAEQVSAVLAVIELADTPRRQIDIDVKVIDVTKSKANESAVKWLVDTLSKVPNKLTVGYDNGLNVGFVQGDLSFAYQVLEESGECVINANPVLSCLEGETAKISFGEKRPVVTDTLTTDGGSQSSSYEYMNIGIGVEVTPYCGESNTVQMVVEQVSDDITGTTLIDGNEVPLMSSREFSSSVRCEVGQALIVGGMRKTNVDDIEVRIPVLSRIPLAGRLFRSTEHRKREVELCVMLCPSVR